jgi:hypothetical protein
MTGSKTRIMKWLKMTEIYDEITDLAGIPEPIGFIQPVPMEADPTELFPGDQGRLAAEARKVLVDLLRRRVIRADQQPDRWQALINHQQVIESRLHELFVRLIVDHDRGLAYKQQIRSTVSDIPVLLRDEQFNRVETVILVHLRTIYQREYSAGESSARVDIEELSAIVDTYLDPSETNLATRQKEISGAVKRLVSEGFIEEESQGRYLITPLVEVVLSVERLTELSNWLRDPVRRSTNDDDGSAAGGVSTGEADSDDDIGEEFDHADADIVIDENEAASSGSFAEVDN